MSQPDDQSSLELSALRDANEILRDETMRLQLHLSRQTKACVEYATSLWKQSDAPETSAVRAAIYKEIAEKIDQILADSSI